MLAGESTAESAEKIEKTSAFSACSAVKIMEQQPFDRYGVKLIVFVTHVPFCPAMEHSVIVARIL